MIPSSRTARIGAVMSILRALAVVSAVAGVAAFPAMAAEPAKPAEAAVPPATQAGAPKMVIEIAGAYVRPTVKGVSLGYLMVRNGGGDDKLVAAASDAAKTVQLSITTRSGEVVASRPVSWIDLPGGREVPLRPGGYHLALNDLVRPLKQGETISLSLTFEKAGNVSLTVPVENFISGEPHRSGAGEPKWY